jgi:hypothetical protein
VNVIILMACTFAAFAQDNLAQDNLGDLMTDRPGFTSPSGVVGLGVLQLEKGYTFQSVNQGGATMKTLSGPITLLRFGVTPTLELGFATNGYSWESLHNNLNSTGLNTQSLSGPSDYTVSAKMRLREQTKCLPEFSVTGGLSIPARGSSFTSGGYDPLFTLAAYKDLPHGFSVAANQNFASVSDPSGRYYSSGESLWLSHKLLHVPVFAEVFHTTLDRQDGSETALDAGIYQGIGKNIQIDAEAGHTVSGSRPAWFASLGFVFRDPHRLFHQSWGL